MRKIFTKPVFFKLIVLVSVLVIPFTNGSAVSTTVVESILVYNSGCGTCVKDFETKVYPFYTKYLFDEKIEFVVYDVAIDNERFQFSDDIENLGIIPGQYGNLPWVIFIWEKNQVQVYDLPALVMGNIEDEFLSILSDLEVTANSSPKNNILPSPTVSISPIDFPTLFRSIILVTSSIFFVFGGYRIYLKLGGSSLHPHRISKRRNHVIIVLSLISILTLTYQFLLRLQGSCGCGNDDIVKKVLFRKYDHLNFFGIELPFALIGILLNIAIISQTLFLGSYRLPSPIPLLSKFPITEKTLKYAHYFLMVQMAFASLGIIYLIFLEFFVIYNICILCTISQIIIFVNTILISKWKPFTEGIGKPFTEGGRLKMVFKSGYIINAFFIIILVLSNLNLFIYQEQKTPDIIVSRNVNDNKKINMEAPIPFTKSLVNEESNSDEFKIALVEHYSPIFYQDTDIDKYEGDYITNFNYDGDWQGNNNWDNLYDYDLNAYIYYSVVETSTHWYIGYYAFHPQDWKEVGDDFDNEHENDMEGVLLVIERSSNFFGNFILMEIWAHNNFYQYTNLCIECAIIEDHENIDGGIDLFEDHPYIFIEAKKHGMSNWFKETIKFPEYTVVDREFPGGDGIIYHLGDNAEIPYDGNDRDVSYELIDIQELWDRRYDIGDGRTYGKFGVFDGVYCDGTILSCGPDKAVAPWGWDDSTDTSILGLGGDGPTFTGEIFFDPANLIDVHFNLPLRYSTGSFDRRYTYNPYVIEVVIDWFKVNWDEDWVDPGWCSSWGIPYPCIEDDLSDAYINLFMYDGSGLHSGQHVPWKGGHLGPPERDLDRLPLYGSPGNQFRWIKDNTQYTWWDMHIQVPRPFYGIQYYPLLFFGLNILDWDGYSGDDWLTYPEQTQFLSPTPGRQTHYNFVGSEIKLTVHVNETQIMHDHNLGDIKLLPPTGQEKPVNPSQDTDWMCNSLELHWQTDEYDSLGHKKIYSVEVKLNEPNEKWVNLEPSELKTNSYSWNVKDKSLQEGWYNYRISTTDYSDFRNTIDGKKSLSPISANFRQNCHNGFPARSATTYPPATNISGFWLIPVFFLVIVIDRIKNKKNGNK